MKDFWKLEDFKSTQYNYITYHIVMTLIGYLLFQIYKSLEEGQAYIGKSLPVVMKNYKEIKPKSVKNHVEENSNGVIDMNVLNNAKYIIKKQYSFKKSSLCAPIVRVLSGVLIALITIFIPKIVLDSVESNVSTNIFLLNLVPTSIVAIVLSYLNYSSNVSMKRWADQMRYTCFVKEINDMAIKLSYDHFVSQECKNYREKAAISVGDSGNSGINNFVPALTELLKNVLGFFAFCIIITKLNPLIIVVMVVSYLIDYAVAMYVEKWIHKNKDKQAENVRKLNYMAYKTRTLSALKDIKMYSMSTWIREVTQVYLERTRKHYSEIERRKLGQLILEGILILARNGIAYTYLVTRILHHGLSIGDFTVFFFAITGFGDWLQNIILLWTEVVESSNYVEDYRNFVNNTTYFDSKYNAGIKLEKPYKIVLEDVCFQYPKSEKKILDNINLEIKSNEKIAVVGNNGAGKTTLIKIICGLLTPTSGNIYINDINLNKIDKNKYYNMISAVFQDVSIMPTTISKNISLCINEKIDEDKVWACLEKAGLANRINQLPKGIYTNLVKNVADDAIELSKGELQRLLLSRAIYKNSSIMILDEPTASLDPIAENQIYLLYNEIASENISIFISHRLSSTRFCDRIIFLKDSKIIETGTHDELVSKSGEYAKLYKMQSFYYNNFEMEDA